MPRWNFNKTRQKICKIFQYSSIIKFTKEDASNKMRFQQSNLLTVLSVMLNLCFFFFLYRHFVRRCRANPEISGKTTNLHFFKLSEHQLIFLVVCRPTWTCNLCFRVQTVAIRIFKCSCSFEQLNVEKFRWTFFCDFIKLKTCMTTISVVICQSCNSKCTQE
jgi:hypothetical protein